jgi:hypothetical protein
MYDIYSTWMRANKFVSLLPLWKNDFNYQNGRYFHSVSSKSDNDFFPIPISFFQNLKILVLLILSHSIKNPIRVKKEWYYQNRLVVNGHEWYFSLNTNMIGN